MNTLNNSFLNQNAMHNKTHINLTDQFHRIRLDSNNARNFSLNMTKNN